MLCFESSSTNDREAGNVSRVGAKTCAGTLALFQTTLFFKYTVGRKSCLFFLFLSPASHFRVYP